jgi:hypothetical protein
MGDEGTTWYEWERGFSQIIEIFTDDQKMNAFRVMVRGVSCGKYQRAFMSVNSSWRLNSSFNRLFLLKLIDAKLGSFKVRILVYVKMISSRKRPFLMAFLSQFATKLRKGQNQEPILGPKEK